MATVISKVQSTYGDPYCFYTLDLSYSNRTATSVTVSYTITTRLQHSSSSMGSGCALTGYVYVGNSYTSKVIKASSEYWSGTSAHTVSGSFTVTGLSGDTSSLATALYVEADMYDGSSSGQLNKTSGTALSIPILSYAVTYNANGGSDAPANGVKYHNKTYTITSGVPTRAGYNFLGWSTSSTATTPLYLSGSSYTSNAPLNLYAVWGLANGKSTVSLSTTRANLGDDIVIYIRTLDPTNLHKVEWTSGNNTYLSHGEATDNIAATLMEDKFIDWFGSNEKVIDITITVTTRTRSGSELGSSSVVFSLCMPDVLGKPSIPIATLSNKTPTSTTINLTKPTTFKYGSTFREWVVSSNIGVIDIVGDIITLTKDEDLNKTGVATIQAMDSRGFLSDPLDIVWHNRRKGVCVFEDGMWNPIVLHAYIDGAWDDNIYASAYVDEQCLISSDNNLLLSSDNYRLKGDDKWQIIH